MYMRMNEYTFAACNNQCIALNQVTDTIESEGLLLHQIQFSFPLLNHCQATISAYPSFSLSLITLFTRSVCVLPTYNDPLLVRFSIQESRERITPFSVSFSPFPSFTPIPSAVATTHHHHVAVFEIHKERTTRAISSLSLDTTQAWW